MLYTSLESFYFSATGTTKKVLQEIGKGFVGPHREYDLLQQPLTQSPRQPLLLSATSLAVVALPVYAGRLPAYCLPSLALLRGQKTPAIAVVVYGNRHYDDALLELTDILDAQGFTLIGAAAFVAQHSIFPTVATGRPDAADCHHMADFARQCAQKLERLADISGAKPVAIPGNRPYKDPPRVALQPSPDDSCTLCGACADICPAQAITVGTSFRKDEARCFSCAACVAVCPTHAQAFRSPEYAKFSAVFTEKCRTRREPELFV
ncbi:MAG: 4Fe-4S binding protein [Desulfovibrionaceae bacterium]